LRGNPAWLDPGLPESAPAAEQLAEVEARRQRH
jgi:hypothetical protein